MANLDTADGQPALVPRPITLALAGDVMLGRLVNETIAREGFAYPWGNLLPIARQADLFLINLECALTSRTERWNDRGEYKAFYFRAAPSVVETLRLGGVTFASLANNHIGDYGLDGVVETVQTLDRGGIAHAGAGATLLAARAPARLLAGGSRISIVACADYPQAWAATPTAPGLNYIPVTLAAADFATVEQTLAAARQDADLVIFSIHWGPNMRARPTAEFRAFARKVVEAGADIFWGHSAHVPQGIEVYQGKLILYDTGDLVDDYIVDEELRNDLSALFLVRVRPPAIEELELLPVRINRMQVNMAEGEDRAWFAARMTTLCAELGTAVETRPERLAVVLPPRSR